MKLTPIKYQEGWLYVSSTMMPKENDKLLILVDELLWGKKGKLCTFIWSDKRRCQVIASNNKTPFTAECDIMYSIERGNTALVVAQSPNLSLPNIPYIEEVDEIVYTKEDMENAYNLACGYHNDAGGLSPDEFDEALNNGKLGHKAAQSKGRYSEVDMKAAFDRGRDYQILPQKDCFKNLIQSLNQSKENIEIEMYNGNTNEPVQYLKDGKTFLKVKQ